MACQHKVNVIIKKTSKLHEEIEIMDGEVALVASGDPYPESYFVECVDCGEEINYPANKVPKWVLRLLAQ